ncbi:MAG TPA: ABC transporter ATP-binding protein [Candidatus Dormibacteraeota bacterium]|nr:ABC transporter ATP-binding protein [Candidatus Dormibacteraeota bacterium]
MAALDHVNLEVQEGAVYALVGQNGAGKTTAIKILMNLISASQGTAEVLGTDSREIRGKSYTQIGYVSENQEIPEWMKVGALLDYLRDFYPTWDLALEQSLVKQFDLPLDRKIRALSRGMKMKLALAGALAFHPRLIVLDEPFGGLDPLVRDQLIEGLLERAAESTVFLSSHDLAEIESFASHVGYLESGKLLFSEDMASLSTRFREIELTRDSDGPLPSPLPASWLQPKTSGAVVRFVDSRFDEQKIPSDIQRLFGSVKDVQYRALSLRAIFLALARKSEEV